MRRAVEGSLLALVISIVIIVFIVSIGNEEISSLKEIASYEEFHSSINKIKSTIDYLVKTNSYNSFYEIELVVPKGEEIVFDNNSDKISWEGVINGSFDPKVDIKNYVEINEEGRYNIRIFYNENYTDYKEYVVVIG